MVPLKLRDELYRLFINCLDAPRPAAIFRQSVKQLEDRAVSRGLTDYLLDRRPRYLSVLKAWSVRERPKEPFKQALALSELLFNHGLYFDTHEFLETQWRKAEGEKKICLQGLIQIGAGLHKLELNPKARAGACELLEKGLAKLAASRKILGERVVQEITLKLTEVLGQIQAGRFELPAAPRLRWAPRSRAA